MAKIKRFVVLETGFLCIYIRTCISKFCFKHQVKQGGKSQIRKIYDIFLSL